MSRYASKAELVDEVRRSIEADSAETGLPTTVRAYNMTGVLRDLDIIGDSHSGWTFQSPGRDVFVAALERNLRTAWRNTLPAQPPKPAQPEPTRITSNAVSRVLSAAGFRKSASGIGSGFQLDPRRDGTVHVWASSEAEAAAMQDALERLYATRRTTTKIEVVGRR